MNRPEPLQFDVQQALNTIALTTGCLTAEKEQMAEILRPLAAEIRKTIVTALRRAGEKEGHHGARLFHIAALLVETVDMKECKVTEARPFGWPHPPYPLVDHEKTTDAWTGLTMFRTAPIAAKIDGMVDAGKAGKKKRAAKGTRTGGDGASP